MNFKIHHSWARDIGQQVGCVPCMWPSSVPSLGHQMKFPTTG